MKNFAISCDSNCDFYLEEYKNLDIFVGRLSYVLTEKNGDLVDCIDNFTCEQDYLDYYAKLSSGVIAKTSILSEEAHYELFKSVYDAGNKNLLHVCQSYGLSPTLDKAKDAYKRLKEEYPDFTIEFVESSSTTVGEQMLVRKAVAMRDSGASLTETKDKLESLKMHLQHFIIVGDLQHLKRGGRISGASAMVGTMLKIKPIIEFNKEGKLETVAKVMGTNKAISAVIEEGLALGKHPDSFNMYVGHTGNMALATKLADKLQEAFGYRPEIRYIGAIIGAHLGPDAVAYAFISEKERQY